MMMLSLRNFIAGAALLFQPQLPSLAAQHSKPKAASELQALTPEFWTLIDHDEAVKP